MAIDFSKIKFFIEGKGDKAFIRDILNLWYGAEFSKARLNELILDCEGYANLSLHIDEFQQVNEGKKREGGINIVIFDADITGREAFHGFNEKLAYLNAKKNELGINFETFLFPDNAKDGTIETLLETCIHPDHKGILDCWHEFENCVNGKGEYTIPADKSKIYVYLECLHGITNAEKEKIKDPKRDFTLTDKWILDHTQNPTLANLKTFLDNHLQQYNR